MRATIVQKPEPVVARRERSERRPILSRATGMRPPTMNRYGTTAAWVCLATLDTAPRAGTASIAAPNLSSGPGPRCGGVWRALCRPRYRGKIARLSRWWA